MPNQGDRFFVVGETVYVRAKVSLPGTKTPVDPDSIVLATLQRVGDDDPLVVPSTFGRLAEGDYSIGIATDDFEPGTYNLTVRVQGPDSDTPVRVVLPQDRFILKSA